MRDGYPLQAELNPFGFGARRPLGLQGLEPWAYDRCTHLAATCGEQPFPYYSGSLGRLESFPRSSQDERNHQRGCVKRRIAIHTHCNGRDVRLYGLHVSDSGCTVEAPQ